MPFLILFLSLIISTYVFAVMGNYSILAFILCMLIAYIFLIKRFFPFHRILVLGILIGLVLSTFLKFSLPKGVQCNGYIAYKYSKGIGVRVLQCLPGSPKNEVIYANCQLSACRSLYTEVLLSIDDKPSFGKFLAVGRVLKASNSGKKWYLELMKVGNGYKTDFYTKLERNFGSEIASVGTSILAGETNLSTELKTEVRELGLLHIIAISGINILYLQKIVSFATEKLRKRYREALNIIVLVVLWVIVGENLSLLRAIVLELLKLILEKGGVLKDRYFFVLAMVIIFIWSPFYYKDASFWLIFAACFAVYVSLNHIEKYTKNLAWYTRELVENLVVWLHIVPVTFIFFGKTTIVGIVWGVLISPLIEVGTIVGYIALLFYRIPFLGGLVLYSYGIISTLLVNLLHLFHS